MKRSASNYVGWPKKGKKTIVIKQTATASSVFGNAAAFNQADASIIKIRANGTNAV
ncbi:hypothetical protein KDJ56_14500 [Brevibacillus composti]|uniref:Uncharacterized protein n=1 Tax=Brevibacillus composti TaxID=2796470 RepID=A0A7T5EIE9_9BACL|nr:hypothetical protein [Brevibacillus composti]QQE73133.1 hypothetical protein JD108_14555 [Brevibacillus composti]QUO40211.1 hypothetical protein KDJ56_14500 [Brevibacillus composti]